MAIEVFPSRATWITLRTDEIKLTTDNSEIILPKKISSINQLLVNLPDEASFTFTGTDYSGIRPINKIFYDSNKTQTINIIDITKYVVEANKFKTLDVVYSLAQISDLINLTQGNCIQWEHNNSKLIKIGAEQLYSSQYIFDVLVASALASYLYAGNNLYIEDSSGTLHTVTYAGTQVITASIMSISNITQKLKFRVYYEPLNEQIKVKVAKELPLENRFEIPYSQQQQIVSSQAFGKNMQATTNRMGVESRIVVRKIDALSKYRARGSVWKDAQGTVWRLTTNNITTKSGFLICEEIWAKNWSMQSEYVSINREFRSWNIPNDIVESNKFYEDWCYLTTNSNLNVTDDSILTATAKIYIAGTPTNAVSNTEISQMFLLNASGNGAVVNATAFGYGNELVFNGRTKDNLSSGIQRDADDSQYCKDVYYAGESGEQTSLYITMSTDMANANSNQYPAVTSSMNNPSGTKLFESVQFLVNKSSAEQVNFTYQCNLVTFDNDIVIGAGWANNCPLTNGNQQARKFYKNCQNIPKGSQTMISSWGTTATASEVISYASSFIFTIQPNCCIADNNNNIIIANNSTTAKTIYAFFTHNIDALYAKYKELYDSTYQDAT